jgi:hypothetical protein
MTELEGDEGRSALAYNWVGHLDEAGFRYVRLLNFHMAPPRSPLARFVAS